MRLSHLYNRRFLWLQSIHQEVLLLSLTAFKQKRREGTDSRSLVRSDPSFLLGIWHPVFRWRTVKWRKAKIFLLIIILFGANHYLYNYLFQHMFIYAVFHTAHKSKPSQMEQKDNNQNSDAEILEEKIDLVRDQVLHRYVAWSTKKLLQPYF